MTIDDCHDLVCFSLARNWNEMVPCEVSPRQIHCSSGVTQNTPHMTLQSLLNVFSVLSHFPMFSSISNSWILRVFLCVCLGETLSPEVLKRCSHSTATRQKDETLTASILIHFQLLVCFQGFASVSDTEVNISTERRRRGGKWVDSNYKTGVVNEYFMWSGSGRVCSLHKLINQ